MIPNTTIITFSGVAGSGKDAAAETLRGLDYIKICLADPIKRIAMDLYGFEEDVLWGPSHLRMTANEAFPLPDGPLTARRALQVLGTEVARHAHPQTWISYWYRTVTKLTLDPWAVYSRTEGVGHNPHSIPVKHRYVVVTDVRFDNELAFFNNIGATTVLVKRAGGGLADNYAQHSSENIPPEDRFKHVIDNCGTLRDLHFKVLDVLRDM